MGKAMEKQWLSHTNTYLLRDLASVTYAGLSTSTFHEKGRLSYWGLQGSSTDQEPQS